MQVGNALWNLGARCHDYGIRSVWLRLTTTSWHKCARETSRGKMSGITSSSTTQSGRPVLHAFDEFRHYDPKDFNFHVGAPHMDELLDAHAVIQKASHDIAREAPYLLSTFYQYGATRGSDLLLERLAAFLSKEYASHVQASCLMMTAGASMALGLVAAEFFSHRRDSGPPVVFVDDPTYFLALDILSDHGFRVVPITKYATGKINFVAFEERLPAETIVPSNPKLKQPPPHNYRALIYIVPMHSNPTGRCLDVDDADELLAFASKQNLLIHCDDVYNCLGYTEETPARLFPVGKSENVISAGTFSKILAPGLRLGWLESSPEIIKRVSNSGVVASGGCLNQYAASLIERALAAGTLQTYVQGVRNLYTEKMQIAVATLRSELPERIRWTEPQGGYFLWLTVPEGSKEYITSVLIPECKKQNVYFSHGTRSCSSRYAVGQNLPQDPKIAVFCTAKCDDSIRLSIGHLKPKDIQEGLRRLCALLKECC